jgi:hypothetical protein
MENVAEEFATLGAIRQALTAADARIDIMLEGATLLSSNQRMTWPSSNGAYP